MDNVVEFMNNERVLHVYEPSEIVLNLLLSLFLGVLISYVYRKTHKGLSYSQSFMITNIFIAVIVCMVIMVIGNNLARAFALVGALSIIRFRTVVKDTKDTSYIFWSLAAGMAAGTGSYFLATIGSAFITLISFILYASNYGAMNKSEFILQFRCLSGDEYSLLYNKIMKEYSKSSVLLHAEPSGDSRTIKLSFDIVMKEDKLYDEFSTKIADIDGISEVVLIAAKQDVDY